MSEDESSHILQLAAYLLYEVISGLASSHAGHYMRWHSLYNVVVSCTFANAPGDAARAGARDWAG